MTMFLTVYDWWIQEPVIQSAINHVGRIIYRYKWGMEMEIEGWF